jgi:hypothetical protein
MSGMRSTSPKDLFSSIGISLRIIIFIESIFCEKAVEKAMKAANSISMGVFIDNYFFKTSNIVY